MYRYFQIELIDDEGDSLYTSAFMVYSEMIKLVTILGRDYPDLKDCEIKIHCKSFEKPLYWVCGENYKEPFPEGQDI